MVKVFALIPARRDISLEQFHSHWRSPHGELATGIDTLRRYVQCHRVRPGLEGVEEAEYEGIAEVWFEDLATAQAMGEHPVYAEQVQPDEANFIDQEGLAFLFAEETVLREGPPLETDTRTIKALVLIRRAEGLAAEQFRRRCEELAGQAETAFPRSIRHVQSIALPESYEGGGEPRADAIEELWWSDRDSFEEDWSAGGEGYLAGLGGAAEVGRVSGFLAEELRLIWPAASPAH